MPTNFPRTDAWFKYPVATTTASYFSGVSAVTWPVSAHTTNYLEIYGNFPGLSCSSGQSQGNDVYFAKPMGGMRVYGSVKVAAYSYAELPVTVSADFRLVENYDAAIPSTRIAGTTPQTGKTASGVKDPSEGGVTLTWWADVPAGTSANLAVVPFIWVTPKAGEPTEGPFTLRVLDPVFTYEPIPTGPVDPNPGDPGNGEPAPVGTLPQRVAAFLGKPTDTATVALATVHAPIVTAYVHGFTRGRGFDVDGLPNPALEAVIVASTARLTANPEQVSYYAAGDYSERPAILAGWTLPELAVLKNYRRATA